MARVSLTTQTCMICVTAFEPGDDYAMVPVAAADPEEAAKAERGDAFVAIHRPAHWLCLATRLATIAGLMRQRAEA